MLKHVDRVLRQLRKASKDHRRLVEERNAEALLRNSDSTSYEREEASIGRRRSGYREFADDQRVITDEYWVERRGSSDRRSARLPVTREEELLELREYPRGRTRRNLVGSPPL